MKLKNRARQMIAYGMSPVVIRWDDFHHRPTWHIRHLETFPSVDIQPGQTQPRIAFSRTAGRLVKDERVRGSLNKLVGFESMLTEDTPMLLLEYIDKDYDAGVDGVRGPDVPGSCDRRDRRNADGHAGILQKPLHALVHIPKITRMGRRGSSTT